MSAPDWLPSLRRRRKTVVKEPLVALLGRSPTMLQRVDFHRPDEGEEYYEGICVVHPEFCRTRISGGEAMMPAGLILELCVQFIITLASERRKTRGLDWTETGFGPVKIYSDTKEGWQLQVRVPVKGFDFEEIPQKSEDESAKLKIIVPKIEVYQGNEIVASICNLTLEQR